GFCGLNILDNWHANDGQDICNITHLYFNTDSFIPMEHTSFTAQISIVRPKRGIRDSLRKRMPAGPVNRTKTLPQPQRCSVFRRPTYLCEPILDILYRIPIF
ncbi:hypothetical protein Tcan_00730, partial [Toxocara canis]